MLDRIFYRTDQTIKHFNWLNEIPDDAYIILNVLGDYFVLYVNRQEQVKTGYHVCGHYASYAESARSIVHRHPLLDLNRLLDKNKLTYLAN